MLPKLFLIIGVVAALALAGCGGNDDSTTGGGGTETSASAQAPESTGESSGSAASESTASKPKVEVPSGAPPKQLESEDLVEGDGTEAKAGDQVTVQYVGVNYESGKQFDASWDRGEPFTFPLGAGEVIAGWDRGVEGMKVGGRRELIIPPDLGYGPSGYPPAIPPNETLVFVIDLLGVK
jgi:peptidylprolyl isomerase